MIPGFNTDVTHDGVTYHVQTEDKGVDAPVILSLVYRGGAILASKRTPYDDLLATDLDEPALAERLRRQHKLICAAIRGGRIEDLKRLGERQPAAEPLPPADDESEASAGQKTNTERNAGVAPVASRVGVPSTAHVVRNGVADFARRGATDSAPVLMLLAEEDLRAGGVYDLRVRLACGAGSESLADTEITARALGAPFGHTEVRARTDANGVATLALRVPAFTAGRAVLLISAAHGGHEVVLRRLIQPAATS